MSATDVKPETAPSAALQQLMAVQSELSEARAVITELTRLLVRSAKERVERARYEASEGTRLERQLAMAIRDEEMINNQVALLLRRAGAAQ